MEINRKNLLLYAITDRTWLNGRSLLSQVEDVLNNGATFLQLREKNLSYNELVEEAVKIKEIAAKYNVPFVINDNIYAAKESGADGVHIGQDDASYIKAREVLGDGKIIGMTAHNLNEALAAQEAGADYIGTGAVFPTSTKQDTIPLSLENLKEITDNIQIPVVAIGGINHENIIRLKGSGIDGAAVISAIFAHENPGLATAKMLNLCREVVNG
ncbi:MAG: thiamine phosphate synthase [Lachnospiraceae bacterium]|nr:thiamine phosphate synthase [Lachnospiraceae bacterium]